MKLDTRGQIILRTLIDGGILGLIVGLLLGPVIGVLLLAILVVGFETIHPEIPRALIEFLLFGGLIGLLVGGGLGIISGAVLGLFRSGHEAKQTRH